jgi:DNA-binding HxlR family transcriptional regulator
MFMQKNPEQCQVVVALDMIVGKWKPMILLYLMNEGTKRFSELKRLLPDITPRMLTLQLRELEAHDIIERKVYPEVPPRVEYSMTEYGRTLEPILEAMHEWGIGRRCRPVRKKRPLMKKPVRKMPTKNGGRVKIRTFSPENHDGIHRPPTGLPNDIVKTIKNPGDAGRRKRHPASRGFAVFQRPLGKRR